MFVWLLHLLFCCVSCVYWVSCPELPQAAQNIDDVVMIWSKYRDIVDSGWANNAMAYDFYAGDTFCGLVQPWPEKTTGSQGRLHMLLHPQEFWGEIFEKLSRRIYLEAHKCWIEWNIWEVVQYEIFVTANKIFVSFTKVVIWFFFQSYEFSKVSLLNTVFKFIGHLIIKRWFQVKTNPDDTDQYIEKTLLSTYDDTLKNFLNQIFLRWWSYWPPQQWWFLVSGEPSPSLRFTPRKIEIRKKTPDEFHINLFFTINS